MEGDRVLSVIYAIYFMFIFFLIFKIRVFYFDLTLHLIFYEPFFRSQNVLTLNKRLLMVIDYINGKVPEILLNNTNSRLS